MSNSVRPHRRQPTRLPRPWDSPGKNTGVGCHFLLQCMKGKSESEVAQSILSPWKCHIQHTLQWERIWLSRVIQYGVPLLSRLSWPLRLQVRSNVSSVKQTERDWVQAPEAPLTSLWYWASYSASVMMWAAHETCSQSWMVIDNTLNPVRVSL